MRILILLAALAAAGPALAFGYDLRFRVTQNSKTDFTVEYKLNAATTDYWCGAGRFVTGTLHLPDRTRIYRLSPPPRKSGQGISFTLDATRSAGTTGLTTFGGPQDGSMSAGGAVAGFCYVYDFEKF
jgi:hypothetical protein